MSFLTQKSKPFLLAAAALSLMMAASCELPAADGVINFEFTGRVLDKDTKEPIEGAYVLAVYEKVDMGFAASARYCVKTKGMLSDKEGKFHFPIDKLDGNSPHQVVAIKPDYYFRGNKPVSEESWKKQNKETHSNRDVYLKKQDPAKPEFLYEFNRCQRPESSEAIEAAVQFTNIVISEQIKHGRDGKNRMDMLESMKQSAAKQTYKETR
jgi:hypothetical protein